VIEQDQSELLNRLLKLSAEEDVISALNNKAFLQPWEYSDEALSDAMTRLKQFGLENPSKQHLTQAAYHCYAGHQQKRCSTSETEKAACLKPRTSIFIPGRGWHYLSDAPDSETGQSMSQCVTGNVLGGLTGTSKITFCGGIHFKFNPKKPGIEYAIHALDTLLFPDQAVTNPSLFIKIRLPDGKIEEALATQTVYGKTADKLPEKDLQFEQAHFTQQCLLQMLTAPGDGKLDNFIISQDKLVGIDNEMAFEPEIVKGEGRKGHVTFIHTFLFFLPQMKNCLDKNLIEQFKNLSVEKLFLLWLKELDARNALYERLARPNLKIVFDQGALKAVYFRLKKIQQFFKTTPLDQITGEMLFKAVMPEVFAYYQELNKKLANQPLQKKIEALQKIKEKNINPQEILSFETFGLILPSSDKIITEYRLKVTEISRQNKHAPVVAEEKPLPEETPKECIKNIVTWINLPSMSESEKTEFFNELKSGELPVQKLELIDETLTGEKLLNLTKKATLSYLYLEKTQVRLEDLKKLMSFPGCAGLELCLGENIHLGLEAWQYLLHSPLCSHFSLKLPNGEILCLKGKSASDTQIHPSTYLQILSQQKRTLENKAHLQLIETLLVQEGYPIKSFEACLFKQNDKTASRFIVSSLRSLIIMLENRNASPEQYLDYYLKLDKPWRQVFYQQISQEVLNKDRCQKIQNMIGEYPDSDGERRLNPIKEKQFRQQLTQLVENTPKSLLPKEKVSIEGLTPGKAWLDKNLTKNLIFEDWLTEDNFNFKRKKEKTKEPEKSAKLEIKINNNNNNAIDNPESDKTTSSVQHGNHLVIPINYKNCQFHCKILPDFPGMEIAYSLLTQRIMGKGSPQVELWKWTYGQHTYPVLVSETIEGENLTPQLLKDYPLEELSYQQHVLMSMLVNPGDGNPGNFIAQKIKASDGSVKLRLVSIDNDRLFAPPFEAGKLRSATIIYCFNEITSPLHKDLRKIFLSLNAYEVLSWWLNSLQTLNQQYCEIFTPQELEKFMSGKLENTSSYLLTMLKRDTVAELFRKIKTLQYWLSVDPQMTLMDLLSKIQPSLANHYQQMRLQYDEPIRRFEEAVKNEYKREEIQGVKRYTSTMHMGQYLKMQGREVTKDKTVESYWKQDFAQAKKELKDLSISREAIELAKLQLIQGNTKGFDDLPEAYAQEEVIAGMDFNRDIRNQRGLPDEKRQQEIILLIINSKGLKSLERLTIQHCAITDGQLDKFLKRLPQLRILKMTNCPHVNTTFYETYYYSGCNLYSKVLEECVLQDMKGLEYFSITLHTLKYLSLKQAPNLKAFYFYSNSVTQLRLSDVSQCNQFDIYAEELQEADFSGDSLLTDLHLQKIVLQCQNLKQMNLQRCDKQKINYLALKEILPVFAEKMAQNEKEAKYLESVAGELSLIAGNQTKAIRFNEKSHISGWLWKCFCNILTENITVVKFEVSGCAVNDEDIILFAKMLEKNQTITDIEFGAIDASDKGVIALANMLKKNYTVTTIFIFSTKITNNSAINFAKVLEHNKTVIEVGFLGGLGLGDDGIIAFAQMLEHNQTVKKIALGANCGNSGIIALSKVIKLNRPIEKLWIIGISYGDEGVIRLAEAIEHNQTTKEVLLASKYIGNNSAIALAKMLDNNPNIAEICITGLYINDVGAEALFDVLKKNNTIKKIDLYANNVNSYLQLSFVNDKRFKFNELGFLGKAGLFAAEIGACSFLINLNNKMNDIMFYNIDSKTEYTQNFFQLNPFTFFSEHADRENAVCYAQNHQQQLNLALKKALESWENEKEIIDLKKKSTELSSAAQSFGFKCKSIAKNGNCLFEAVSQQLKVILPNQKQHHFSHLELRKMAVSYIMKHQEFYENFVEDHNFASFIHKMGLPGTWGEHIALNALAHILDMTIVVVNSDNSPPVVLKKPNAQGIIYLGYEVNLHYQVLERDLNVVAQHNIQAYIDKADFMEEPKKLQFTL